VLHVSTADALGGAEAVALGLHQACLVRGWDSRLVVGRRALDLPGVVALEEVAPSLASRWRAALRSYAGAFAARPAVAMAARALADPRRAVETLLGVEHFGYPASWRLLEATPGGPPDVVHVHNLHGDYFDLRALAPLSRRRPVLTTMHDDWLMTGHCALALGCERWRSGCGRCPDLEVYPRVRRDATRFNWGRKRRALEGARLHVATPSRWLLRRAEASLLAPAIVERRVIPNGVDLERFRPGPRDEARRALGLDPRARVLLFVASSARTNPFKDFACLLAAVRRLAERHAPLVLVTLGEEGPPEQAGAATLRFGRLVDDPAGVALYQQAADVYVHATRVESATPRAVQEAMACGRPVVASAVGAISEGVDDGRTGLLVAPGDPRALADAVDRVLSDSDLAARLGAAAAEKAAREFDGRDRVDDYLEWYRALAGATA
jgi:glycosyltransferase involved in cell wall biosynthesis